MPPLLLLPRISSRIEARLTPHGAEQAQQHHGGGADRGAHQRDDEGEGQEGAGQGAEAGAAGDDGDQDAAYHAEQGQAGHPPAVLEAGASW